MSNLADNSDYTVRTKTEARAEPLWQPAWENRGVISGHDRHQSAWTLVAKAATWAAKEAEKHT
jgi:hypothetical protein